MRSRNHLAKERKRHTKFYQNEKTLVFAKKLPLNSMFKEALAKSTGNRKPVYSTPLVT